MDTKPLMFDIIRYVQRCDDHTVVCETYPSACGFGCEFSVERRDASLD